MRCLAARNHFGVMDGTVNTRFLGKGLRLQESQSGWLLDALIKLPDSNECV